MWRTVDAERDSQTPAWSGGTRIDGPVPAVTRNGAPATRHGTPFLTGTVFALDETTDQPAARLTFEVYETTGMVLLGNADADGLVGGVDRRQQGAGRAMMDALDEHFSDPEWWLAVDPADHTPQGHRLMLSRRRPGRKWVHASTCEARKASQCSCEL